MPKENLGFLQTLSNPTTLSMKIKTFTHDYYIMTLQNSNAQTFYKDFPLYKFIKNFRNQMIKIAPIVRIYGTNQFGQKCCCHIHGYFSSFYIKLEQIAEYMKDQIAQFQFLNTLEQTYQNVYKTLSPIIFRAQYEYKYDFYGYHLKKQPFLKIYLYDPHSIGKMRQLLSSKIINNKAFQCYQAHISYFMQLFTDLNIYGIHQMQICGFKFRKNADKMSLFKKFQPKIFKGLMKQGWNLVQLQYLHPNYFNQMHKGSSCYIEIDINYQSILNFYQNTIQSESEEQNDQALQNALTDQGKNIVKLKVEVTAALKELWSDEKRRRQKFGISQKLIGLIDYSKNIQGNQKNKSANIFQVQANFIKKGCNTEDFIKMIQSYSKAKQMQKKFAIQTNYLSIDFQQKVQSEKQQLVENVKNKWKFYMKRKNNIICQILKGDVSQLPQWADEQVETFQSQGSDSQSQSDKSESQKQPVNVFQILMQKSNSSSNTQKYRNNFQNIPNQVKKQLIFSDKCLACKNYWDECWCKYFDQNLISKIIQNDPNCLLQFIQPPPLFQSIVNQQLDFQHQRPFYSDFSDLIFTYNLQQFNPCLKVCQLIDKYAMHNDYSDRKLVTIQQQLKLPYYFEICELPQKLELYSSKFRFQYPLQPPSEQQIAQQTQQNKQKKQKVKRISLSLTKFQNTFMSDLIMFKYQIFVETSNKNKFYGECERDKIKAIFLQISNYQKFYKRIKCLIYQENIFKDDQLLFDQYQQIFSVKNEKNLLQLLILIIFKIDPDLLISFDQQRYGMRYLVIRALKNGVDFAQAISRSGNIQQIINLANFQSYTVKKQTYLKSQFLKFGQFVTKKQDKVQNIIQPQLPDKDIQAKQNIETSKQSQKEKSQKEQSYKEDSEKKESQKEDSEKEEFKNEESKNEDSEKEESKTNSNEQNSKPKSNFTQKKRLINANFIIKGRVILNLSRFCELQLKLRSYTLENIARQLFNIQLPQFVHQILEELKNKKIVQKYYLDKLSVTNMIIHQLNIIGGIVQKSKIYGADFISMMQRGSQFKIESIMCRVTKKRHFLTLSASKNQVGNQSILQCRPLVLQPPKEFYQEPVLLFDFQSLYPSIMIAYNICYSTCLGSIKQHFKDGKLKKLGVSQSLSIDLEQFEKLCQLSDKQLPQRLSQLFFVTPNKVAFVKKNVRQGLLPKILHQFLLTRIMIKNSGKLYKKQSILHILKQRQTALKLFMNVMFGYTGASFSGRMPCSQIADSVVQTAKYCLRKSMDYLNNHPKYKGKVIYGDTDSLFFHIPSENVENCFQIGKQLANEITKLFPYPIEMKFQKVYQSLVLVSKKRYYGKSFQTKQSKPKYQGKGLQCVRRDGIQLTSKLMTDMIDLLIDTKDLSLIKNLFIETYETAQGGYLRQNYFVMAKQVKLLKYSQKSMPAHGHAALRLKKLDQNMTPKYGQRMKYVIKNQLTNNIKDRAAPLFEHFKIKGHKIDYQYYCNKMIVPPLHRVFFSLFSLNKFIFKAQTDQINNESPQRKKRKRVVKEKKEVLKGKMNILTNHSQKLLQLHLESVQICKKCVKNQSHWKQCIQYNCKNLFIRNSSQTYMKKFNKKYTQILKAVQAIKQRHQMCQQN